MGSDEFAASMAVVATLLVVAFVWYRMQRPGIRVSDFIRAHDSLDD